MSVCLKKKNKTKWTIYKSISKRKSMLLNLTQQTIGISTPNICFGVTPKFVIVSTISGNTCDGIFNKLNIQVAHFIVNGSNSPVADALETSVICLPMRNE